MQKLSHKVERRLVQLFAIEDQEQASSLLLDECAENIPGYASAGLDRLQSAALKLSGGDLSKLRATIQLAKRDFRDVLMAAGFGEPESHLSWRPGRQR